MEHWPHVTGGGAVLEPAELPRSPGAHSHGGDGLEKILLDHNLTVDRGKKGKAHI